MENVVKMEMENFNSQLENAMCVCTCSAYKSRYRSLNQQQCERRIPSQNFACNFVHFQQATNLVSHSFILCKQKQHTKLTLSVVYDQFEVHVSFKVFSEG